MNKVLNFIAILMVVSVFFSCKNKDAEKKAEEIKSQQLSVPQNINTVSALAKIEPEDGLIQISSETGGIVKEIYKKEGDFVARGNLILSLNSKNEDLSANVVREQILQQKKSAEAEASNVRQYQIQLANKNRDLQIAERLAKTGAETRENVSTLRKDRDVISANLATAQKNAVAAQKNISVMQAQLQQATQNTNAKNIYAKTNGTITKMDAEVGASIAPLTAFATLAPSGNLVAHGEIDEMFANRVKMGDEVSVKIPGTNEVVGKARVTFLSPTLEDKSLFYEKAGEQSDRRVRRFKAVLEKEVPVLINQRVECIINLK